MTNSVQPLTSTTAKEDCGGDTMNHPPVVAKSLHELSGDDKVRVNHELMRIHNLISRAQMRDLLRRFGLKSKFTRQ